MMQTDSSISECVSFLDRSLVQSSGEFAGAVTNQGFKISKRGLHLWWVLGERVPVVAIGRWASRGNCTEIDVRVIPQRWSLVDFCFALLFTFLAGAGGLLASLTIDGKWKGIPILRIIPLLSVVGLAAYVAQWTFALRRSRVDAEALTYFIGQAVHGSAVDPAASVSA